MRQIIGVLAVLLILSAVAWEDVEARGNPYGYSDPYLDDVNEDHPWGGEDNVTDDPPPFTMPGRPGDGLSLVSSNFDFLFNFFISIWIDNTIIDDPANTEINSPGNGEESLEGRVTNNN